MYSKEIYQFKFSDGQEVLCEVMEWPDKDDKDIIARNSMSILMGETSESERIYMFRPWIHYLEGDMEYTSINPSHIVSQNRPNSNLMEQYFFAVRDMHIHAQDRDQYLAEEREYLEEHEENLNELKEALGNYEKDGVRSNVIKFPKRDDIIH